MISKIEHVGVAVKDIDNSIVKYKSILGLEIEEIEEIRFDDVSYRVAFIPVGGMSIELVHARDKKGIVFDWLENHGEGVFHLAFEVTNLEEMFQDLRSKGVEFVTDTIRNGSRGTKIVLIKPDALNNVYVELVEKPKN